MSTKINDERLAKSDNADVVASILEALQETPEEMNNTQSETVKTCRKNTRKIAKRTVLWPYEKTPIYLYTKKNMFKLEKTFSCIKKNMKILKSELSLCSCTTSQCDHTRKEKESLCNKSFNAKFTTDNMFPKISIKWLQNIASNSTRSFISELMKVLFELSEIKNRSATGSLPPAGKRGNSDPVKKKAIDAVRRDFIFVKVQEKYSEYSKEFRENELRYVNMHISSICNQVSKLKNDSNFKRSRFSDPNEIVL